jgi:hypothetical protein
LFLTYPSSASKISRRRDTENYIHSFSEQIRLHSPTFDPVNRKKNSGSSKSFRGGKRIPPIESKLPSRSPTVPKQFRKKNEEAPDHEPLKKRFRKSGADNPDREPFHKQFKKRETEKPDREPGKKRFKKTEAERPGRNRNKNSSAGERWKGLILNRGKNSLGKERRIGRIGEPGTKTGSAGERWERTDPEPMAKTV